jgi:glycosyltransferase involved in cell wall biosynthesis
MKVTVLIPNYNNATYLLECLDSIKNQTFKHFEILIIDDCSTDDSITIINSFDDDRIKLIKKERNSGIIETLNIGLDLIKTEYIIRMDGDDIMHKQRIEKLVNFMDNNLDFGVCGSGVQHFGISQDCVIYEKEHEKIKTNIIHAHTIAHASVIYRTSVLNDNNIRYTNGYNYIEDYKIFYDLLKVTKLTSIPDVLYYYRREEYNNYKNKLIKKKGYLKIYSTVLSKLNFTNLELKSLIHYELFHNVNLTFKYSTYTNHIKSLKRNNNTTQTYNSSLIDSLLKQFKEKLFYRAIDQKKLNLIDKLTLTLLSPSKLYYMLSSILKRPNKD